jgi:tetratricopeptide (TPR) repeat protein
VQQVEMLCEFRNFDESRLRAKFLPIITLIFALVGYTGVAEAQSADLTGAEGRISGTVLTKADHRPAGQVAVRLKSHVAGIFRSLLTDVEGHFEVPGLPAGTYEIDVEEPGYESARSSAQLNGPSAELVIYLRPSNAGDPQRNGDTVSVRELRIPSKARDEYQKGLQRMAKNDAAGGLSHFKKAVQAFPSYYEARYHIGAVELKMDHRDEAMVEFQTAIDMSGGRYALAEFGLGYLLYLQGKAGEAEGVIRRGLELDESSPTGYAILGMALLRLDRADEAERSAREAILRDPRFGLAHLVLADVHARRAEHRMQVRELDIYLELDPSGSASGRVRQAREVALRNLAQSHTQE